MHASIESCEKFKLDEKRYNVTFIWYNYIADPQKSHIKNIQMCRNQTIHL